MNKLAKILLHTAPLVLGIILAYFLWRHNGVLLVIYLLLVFGLILFGKDRKVEALILLYGIIAALVVEIIGTQVSGYQTFNNPDRWGIPYWLPLSWGYGFILMKRIGLIISTGSAWTKK